MVKRLFEYVSLGILTLVGLLKLKGKTVNPPALRVLLAILSAMAIYLGSSRVLLVSGTWLIFLLLGDLARLFGLDLRLFVPDPAKKASEGKVSKSAAKKKNPASVIQEPAKKAFLKNYARRFKAYIHGEEV